jgi:hypothetical protein
MDLPSLGTSLRILALQAVRDKTDGDARYRHVCRWYSQTFHTPLKDVFDLDEGFVLQHYYEHHFEGLDDAEWRREVQETIETPEEREARLRAEAAADRELLRRAAADRELLKRRPRPATMGSEIAQEPAPELPSADDRLRAALASMPASIEPAKAPGDRLRARVEQIKQAGFAEDAFEVRLGEAPPPEDIEMGVKMPPAAPKKRRL